MIVFRDDDRGFIAWRDAHPEGFIVNAHRKPNPEYLRLHRATCPFLRMNGDRQRWTKDYIKICSRRIDDLDRWAAAEVSGYHGLQPCACCNP